MSLSGGASMKTRLVLVRHGATERGGDSGDLYMNGWADVPLSEKGRGQAERVGNRLATECPDAPIYSSSLLRASETARIIAGNLLDPLEPARAVRYLHAIREISCGLLDGWKIADVERRYPELWAANLRQADDDFRWPGGESYRRFRKRCLRGVRSVAAAHAGGEVIIVTHAGVISEVIGAITDIPPARWDSYRPGNASITLLDWEGDEGTLVSFDDREHLSTGG